MNRSNIQRVANMYSAFQNYKGGRGPADAAEFKTFIKDLEAAKLSMMGIDPGNVDSIFTSERDGKPFIVRYKVGGGKGSVEAVAFEQNGKDGKKQVAFTGNSRVDEVDDATYSQLRAGKGPHQPAAGGPIGDQGSKEGRPAGGRPKDAPTGPAK